MAALLELRGVAKDFGGVKALAGVNLVLGEGELRCIIGPNGCGKTTLFNVVTGAFAPTAGEVYFGGADIAGLPPHAIARLGVGRKFQVPGIYPALTVLENLEIPSAAKEGRRGPLRLARGGGGVRLRCLLERFGLAEVAFQPAGTLPHGQKQWLEIAMLLASEARLLLLDEPTAGMSATESEATAALIGEIRRDSAVTILIIEHDMSFVRRLDCPVLVMMRGAIFCEGSYEEVRRNPTVHEAYLGRPA